MRTEGAAALVSPRISLASPAQPFRPFDAPHSAREAPPMHGTPARIKEAMGLQRRQTPSCL